MCKHIDRFVCKHVELFYASTLATLHVTCHMSPGVRNSFEIVYAACAGGICKGYVVGSVACAGGILWLLAHMDPMSVLDIIGLAGELERRVVAVVVVEKKEKKKKKKDRRDKKKSGVKRKKTRRRGNKKKENNIHIALEVAGLEWRTCNPTRSRMRSSCGKKCDCRSGAF